MLYTYRLLELSWLCFAYTVCVYMLVLPLRRTKLYIMQHLALLLYYGVSVNKICLSTTCINELLLVGACDWQVKARLLMYEHACCSCLCGLRPALWAKTVDIDCLPITISHNSYTCSCREAVVKLLLIAQSTQYHESSIQSFVLGQSI